MFNTSSFSRLLLQVRRKFFVTNFHTHSFPLQAGHSKWANIRHIKALKDGQKSVTFTKLARQIRLAIQDGGSADPKLNSGLQSIIEEALRKNMPMSTIQNNIKKSQQNKAELKKHQVQLRYKQKVFATCILYSDNIPGLKMEMATIVRKAGAMFIDASHLFEDCGLVEAIVPNSSTNLSLEERATEDAIDCGAEEVEIIDNALGAVNFICNAVEMPAIRKALENKGYAIKNTEHVFVSKQSVQLTPDEQKSYDLFLQKLRALPGLEDIYDNVNST